MAGYIIVKNVLFVITMKNLCKVSLNGNDEPCEDSSIQKIEFSANLAHTLSLQDITNKEKATKTLIDAAKRCVLDGECKDLDILALDWEKCDVCKEHIPELFDEVVKPIIAAGIPVRFRIADAKKEGLDTFIEAGCTGTPCILVKNHNTGKYVKAYDGRQKSIGALSSVLGMPNPFFVDIKGKKPLHMLKGDFNE